MTDTELKELMATHIQYMQKSDEELRELVKTNTTNIGILEKAVSANAADLKNLKFIVYGVIVAVIGALARSFF